MSPRARTLWLGVHALALFLAFPQPAFGRIVDLGWLFAWIVPASLILGVAGDPPGAAARRAFLASWLGHAAVLHWIFVVTVSYGHAPAAVGVLAPFGLAAYMAGFGAAFGAGAAWLERAGRAGPFALAALWAALDHARSFVLTGFPWATLGYAQHENPALLGLAAWTGVVGLSFVSALGGAGLAALWRARAEGRRPPARALAALAAVVALHAFGAAFPAPAPPEDAPRLRVAALQGNIEQGAKWSREWADRTLAIYEGLSERAAAQGARVIVWPETAVPGALEADPRFADRLADLARRTGAVHVVGSVGLDRGVEDWDVRFFDSAFVIRSDGVVLDRYDKSHLVPFGEYVPLRDWLGRFVGAVARGIASTDVSAGAAPRPVVLPVPGDGPEAGGHVIAGVPICYELLFPDGVRRFVRDGAQVLLAITNDAWYGQTGAPHQFLAITALRSAETGAWTVRAANTGVSAVIDGRGRVREQLGVFEPGVLVADVPLLEVGPGAPARSFYARHGDVFAWACWAFAGAALARVGWKRLGVRRGGAERGS